ncbi:fasciclin domain-containing protein [Tundrisphaera lichenicola]|uniref:fasciclin domain-containing protein n=1 Tax=Tundrisphaera lichenicola TaxID=2029860 RepID=UPI003EBFD6D7
MPRMILALGLLVPASAWADQQDILSTAASAGSFRTLVSAVVLADLDGALKGNRPLTVLAPTDEAFAKLPPGTLEALLKPEGRGDLIDLLKYHVLPGRIAAHDLANEKRPASLNGASPTIAANGHGIAIDGAVVVQADIACRNGLIHAIDHVLIPPKATILRQAERAGYKTFLAAIEAAGLGDALEGDGPFTVFVPSEEAFERIHPNQLKALLEPKNRETLTSILKYHVLPRALSAAELSELGKVATLEGPKVKFSTEGGPKVNKSRVIRADLKCENGIIHVIDRVLTLPKPSNRLPEVLGAEPRFKILVAALRAAGLDDDLEGDGPFTVLAPTDEAFGKLGDDKVRQLLEDPSKREMLRQVLRFHVISGKVSARDAVSSGKATTTQGSPVKVGIEGGRLRIGDASAIDTDLKADNGIYHVIDSVLIPH